MVASIRVGVVLRERLRGGVVKCKSGMCMEILHILKQRLR